MRADEAADASEANRKGRDAGWVRVREILSGGNSADRQLRIWNANRDVVEVAGEQDEPATFSVVRLQRLLNGEVAHRRGCRAARACRARPTPRGAVPRRRG